MPNVIDKAKPIKLLILDVDGVLTSGEIYYGLEEVNLKGFHIHDGMGIKLLQKANIVVAIISAKNSPAVAMRAKELNIQHVYLGSENKIPAYEELKSKLHLENKQIAFMGDDLPDLPLLRRAGFAITVPEGHDLIRDQADYITLKSAGQGAVREACEFILKAQEQYQAVIQSYLTE